MSKHDLLLPCRLPSIMQEMTQNMSYVLTAKRLVITCSRNLNSSITDELFLSEADLSHHLTDRAEMCLEHCHVDFRSRLSSGEALSGILYPGL